MSGFLNLSEAAALAIHTMVLLAGHTAERLTTRQIAREFNASENHLAKVMQQLVKNNLLNSTRGPAGGFQINHALGDITLMDVYEAIDGKFADSPCLFGAPVCSGTHCVLGNLANDLYIRIRDYFRDITLEDLQDNPVATRALGWQT